jgi:hypothetical protein
MTKPILITIAITGLLNILLLSCNTAGHSSDTRASVFDSVIKKYIASVDSNTTGPNEYDYLLLKNYVKKDKAYFIQFNRQLNKWDSIARLENNFRCVRLEPLNIDTHDAESAYRFHLTQSFAYYDVAITVYKKKDKATLQLLQYGYRRILPDGNIRVSDTCKIIKSLEKEITIQQWDSLAYKIHYANYWGMKSYDHESGLDGSGWILEGIERSSMLYNGTLRNKSHRVYRWSPHNTAYEEIGLYMLRLAGAEDLLQYR